MKTNFKFSAIFLMLATLVCALIAGASIYTLSANTANAETAEEVVVYRTVRVNQDNFVDEWNKAVNDSKAQQKPVEVTLGTDIVAENYCFSKYGGVGFDGGGIFVPEGADIILDLQGNTIDRHWSGNNSHSGSVIRVDGKLTLKDSTATGEGENYSSGAITGGSAVLGGGVYIVHGTFIMDGGMIDDNSAGASQGGGSGVCVGGTFIMNGGKISNNFFAGSSGGSAVYVGSGNFTMNGGIIYKNTSYCTRGGGGVFMWGGTFDMNGGKISENKLYGQMFGPALGSGGVYVDETCTFNMSGGEISNNYEGDNGGVFVHNDGTFNLKGSPRIKNNTVGGNINNINGKKINIVGKLDDGAEIWVGGGDGTVWTNGYSAFNNDASPSEFFFSETDKNVILCDNEVCIADKVPDKEVTPDEGANEADKEETPDESVTEPDKEETPDESVTEPDKEETPDESVTEPDKEETPDGGTTEADKEVTPDEGTIEPDKGTPEADKEITVDEGTTEPGNSSSSEESATAPDKGVTGFVGNGVNKNAGGNAGAETVWPWIVLALFVVTVVPLITVICVKINRKNKR